MNEIYASAVRLFALLQFLLPTAARRRASRSAFQIKYLKMRNRILKYFSEKTKLFFS